MCRNNFGLSGAPGIPGDAIPFDGIVDLGDLNAVRNNFGIAAGSATVPEPGALGLTLVALLGGMSWQCRRRRSIE